MEVVIIFLYILVCTVLFIYSLVEFSLLLSALFRKAKHPTIEWDELPHVTIQLPVYNEAFVIERLIDCVAKLNYPKEKLEIQVLDDSTDETSLKAKERVAFYAQQGLDIQHIQRPHREGYKAGALDYGLRSAKGKFIAIFDADFLPSSDFLLKAMPYFADEKTGVVQSRWTYVNERFSFLTRIQTIMLNTHFAIEHAGRNRSGAFINFNGTGGIWRRTCIDDAGGWMSDTLTEDLDLSFRAQMKNWQFVYVKEIESPSELPITFPGYKAQQFRWAKGAAECARKNIPQLLRSKTSTLWAKLIGSFHLLNSSVFLVVLCFVLFSFPLTYALAHLPSEHYLKSVIKLFMISNILLLSVFVGGLSLTPRKHWSSIVLFPFTFLGFLVVNLGVALYMSLGVAEGYLGRKSEFVRTPKFNVRGGKNADVKKYTRVKVTPLFLLEFLLFAYGFFQLWYAYHVKDAYAMVFAGMFSLGLGYNVLATLYYSTRNA
jgi:cellulose synthase/poly-beta-1,6-N-acetylglucosamine synthase-like glycosyltransferase